MFEKPSSEKELMGEQDSSKLELALRGRGPAQMVLPEDEMATRMIQMQQELNEAGEIIESLEEVLSDMDEQNSKLTSELKRKSVELRLAQTASSRAKQGVSTRSRTEEDLLARGTTDHQTARVTEPETHESIEHKLRSVMEELKELRTTHARVVAERDWYQTKTQRFLELLGTVESSRSEIHDCVRGIGSFYIEHCNRLSRQLEQVAKSDKELQEDLRKARMQFSEIQKECDDFAAQRMADS